MCTFFGIKRFDWIAADGMDLGLEAPQVILERAMHRASDFAKNF
jgi:FMN-dependent NADH-azoreductase